MPSPQVIFDHTICIGCGSCIKDCPGKVLEPDEKGLSTYVNAERCIMCGHCVTVCPVEAVSIPAYDASNFPEISDDPVVGYDDLLAHIRRRRSVRRYFDTPVDDEIISKLLAAARYAPTGTNSQDCRFTIFRGKENVRKVSESAVKYFGGIADMASKPWGGIALRIIAGAKGYARVKKYIPMFREVKELFDSGEDLLLNGAPLLVCISMGESFTAASDCAIAGTHMVLAAESLGLGSCYIGFLTNAAKRSKDVTNALHLDEGYRLHLAITFGYSTVKYRRAADRYPLKVKYIGD